MKVQTVLYDFITPYGERIKIEGEEVGHVLDIALEWALSCEWGLCVVDLIGYVYDDNNQEKDLSISHHVIKGIADTGMSEHSTLWSPA